jgi:hypothetical protein
MPTSKEELIKFVKELPDDSTIDDIEYYLYVRRKIEHGREAIRRGEFFTQEEVERRMNEWKEKLSGRPNP